mgnify:CR=1 FL=1
MKIKIVISVFVMTLLCLISCRIEQDRSSKDPLNSQMLGFNRYYTDSLKLTLLSQDTLDWELLNNIENQYRIEGKKYKVLPYYLLKLKSESSGQLCFSFYSAAYFGNESLSEKDREKLRKMGMKYLQIGAMLNDSTCINELRQLEAK